MTDESLGEVEKVLLHISDARRRAAQAADRLEKSGVDLDVVRALRDAQLELDRLHRGLAQGTYYARPEDTLRLAV